MPITASAGTRSLKSSRESLRVRTTVAGLSRIHGTNALFSVVQRERTR